jgi:hypothetical protein
MLMQGSSGMNRALGWLGVTAAMLALGAAAAIAQPAPDRPRAPAAPPRTPATAPERARPAEVGPWHKGVSTEHKTQALALYNVGNTFFAKSQWSAALVKYAVAVKLWDHPGIRYNMAKCLMELKRYLEAHASLKLALRFGAAPLDPPRLYKEGRFLMGVLNRLLVRVRIVCHQPGVRVTLDGRLLFVGPGEKTRLMDPAKRHVVVATKRKHITVTRTLAPLPGRLVVVTLKLMRLKKTLVMKRRWARWMPWTVLAAGAAVAVAGIPMVLKAVADFKEYDKGFDAWCHEPAGCFLSDRPPDLVDKHDKALVSRALAVTLLAVGGVGIATGVTLVILNIPRAMSPERAPRPSKPRVSLVPTVRRGGGSVTLTLLF